MGKWKDKRWTQREVDFLLEHYDNDMWGTEIAEYLGRTPTAVARKWHDLKKKKKGRQTKTWTEEEVKFLIDNYDDLTPQEIANKLGRTRKSIILKAHNQKGEYEKISKRTKLKQKHLNTTAKKWSKEDAQKLTELYLDGRISELELTKIFPDRTIDQIRGKAQRFELSGKYGKRNCQGDDGRCYDSAEEAFVANRLYEAGIKYRKNTKYFYYNNMEYFVPDFIVEDEVVLEYFGLIRDNNSDWWLLEEYKKRHDRKLAYFQGHPEIKFIALYPEDLNNVKEKVKEVIYDT